MFEGDFNVPGVGMGKRWSADPDVTSIPDVTDPLALTDFQQSMSVRFIYWETSSFTLGFARETAGGNKQQFTGATNTGSIVCPNPR